MKKFAIIDHIGTWEMRGGKMCIDCTVKRYELIAESNELSELKAPRSVEYRDDGTWHSYSVEKRAAAKRWLNCNR